MLRFATAAALLAVSSAAGADWRYWTETYDAEVYDYCIEVHGYGDAARNCMRRESRIARRMLDELRAEVRNADAREEILIKCRDKDLRRGGMRVRQRCVKSEIAHWRLYGR